MTPRATLLIAVLAVAGCDAPPDAPRAIDGDTLAIGDRRIRVLGVDAPEIRARCEAERILAERARLYVAVLLRGPEVEVLPTGRRDRDRRELARVRVGGEDLADLLIAAGLGRPYDGRGRREGWCP